MRPKTKYLLIALFTAIITLSAGLTQISYAEEKPKVVFFLIDNVTWEDIILAEDEFFNRLIDESAIGLLNNRTYGRPSRPRGTLTVGSGVRANAVTNSLDGYNATEEHGSMPVADVFFLRTGKRAQPHNVVELGLPSIINDNRNIRQEIVPGALGQILKDNGYRAAVLGNSDTSFKHGSDYNNREIVDVAMDADGIVDYGNVGKNLLVRDLEAPFGLRTNDTLMLAQFKDLMGKADFVAIDYGDTTRADLYASYVLPERTIKMKSDAIKRAGGFIKQAREVSGDDTVFIIASLSPPGAHKSPVSGKLEQLTLLVINGPGFEAGTLKSDTTRRAGIVGNVDITKTILDIYGLEPHYSMVGSIARIEAVKTAPETLSKFNTSAMGIKSGRRTAILTFIYLQIALYLIAALLLLWKGVTNRRYIRLLETLILTSMGFPLFSYFTSKIDGLAVNGTLLTATTLALSLLLAVILGLMRRNKFVPLAVICGATLTALIGDVLLGGQLQLNTIFGYDPIRGSRFFGMGNEAMSILLATSLLTIGVILERWHGLKGILIASVIALLVLVVDGFPTLGADVGGIIAFVAAFIATWFHYKGIRFSIKNLIIGFSVIAVALTAFIAYDIVSDGSTHMGKSIKLISDGGASQMFLIIERKLSENIKILRFSTWSYFLLVILLLMISLSYRPVGLLKKLFSNYKGLAASVVGAAVGGAVGFAVNDSGILIPAITMSYVFPFIVYLMLREKYQEI